MVPRSLQRQLNRLRRRERLLRLTWAVARCVAVFAVVLAFACLLDFLVDLYRDTPRWLRIGLLGVQMALWVLGGAFVLRQIMERMSDTFLSLWIEEKLPHLGHRLISAVQLNRPDAATEGMSPELIAAVTRQAEEQAVTADFACIADRRRLQWSGLLLSPLAILFSLVLLLWPDTMDALFARQFLADRPIPRSLAIESVNVHQVWPAGEEGVLRFRVRGAVAEQICGEVRLDTNDGDSERHEMIFEAWDDSGAAMFLARVPPSSRDFSYRAWLKDGRTHQPAEVHFEPRPIVQRQRAWVQLPSYLGLKANGQPFEEPQKGADLLYRLPGSAARVAIETQKPIVKATLEVLGPPHFFAEPIQSGKRAEAVHRSVDLAVQADGRSAEGTFSFQPSFRPEVLGALAVGSGGPAGLSWAGLFFATRSDLPQTETAYRIVVCDAFGLENSDKPRRRIRAGIVEPPEVRLLPERLARKDGGEPTEEDEIEGIPILLGQRVPLAYECRADYGLSHANLRYRVIPRTASRDEEDEPNEDEFRPLPLGTRRGASGEKFPHGARERANEFFTKPADGPDTLGGIEGGGRYDFDSAGIPDDRGGLLPLHEGDRIQFYVEVFGRAAPDGAPGRSALREKEVVNEKDFWSWVERKEDHKERLRQLEEKQHAAAGVLSLLPEERPRLPSQRMPLIEPSTAVPKNDNVLGRDWQLLGPFANDADAGHKRVYPPELGNIDLSEEYPGIEGKMSWREYRGKTDKVDLQKFFGRDDAGVAYAVCWIKPAGRMRAQLVTGSDDGIKVWLNRRLVLDKAVHREAVPGDDQTPLVLEGGWQELLVKVDNRFGTWAFYLDLLDRSGKPLRHPRLQVRTTPMGFAEGKTFVKDWLIAGPFVAPKGDGHGKEFPPERDAVDLQRAYEGRNDEVRWKAYHSHKGRVNLLEACGLRPEVGANAVAYAVCWVRSNKDRLALLATGSDDGIKVWIDGKIVHDRAGRRTAKPSSERTSIRLKTGWNEVRVKIDNYDGEWSFYLELLDPSTGQALPGVQYRSAPPEKIR